MSKTHDCLTARARALGWVLAIGMLGAACGGDDEKKTDSGSGNEDSGVQSDGGTGTGGSGDAGKDAGVDAGKDSGGPPVKVDAGPVDPIVPGADAPTLADGGVAFYDDDAGGPRVLIKGRDPNGDIKSFNLDFFFKPDGGEPTSVAFDLDGDGDMPAVSSFPGTIKPVPNEAGFFVLLEQTDDFAAVVNMIDVTVRDEGGRESSKIRVSKQAAPVQSSVGGACDPYGFKRCSASNVCAKSGANSTTYTCQALSAARTGACGMAQTLSPPDKTTVWGSLGTSLWDTPAGCSVNNPKGKPDSVVKLRLSAPAAKVTLSTDNPGTDIADTILYRLSQCTADAAPCPDTGSCSCGEDISDVPPFNRRSKLELTNVEANKDYFIVVDSFPTAEASGTDYELTVVVE